MQPIALAELACLKSNLNTEIESLNRYEHI